MCEDALSAMRHDAAGRGKALAQGLPTLPRTRKN
jgi:hypothetical protein